MKHLLIITPGFPENEGDTKCIPALQIYLKELQAKKIFKIKSNSDSKKSKNKTKARKSYQNSSASNYIIKPGFKRPGR